MPNFLARIEIHDGSSSDYEALYETMRFMEYTDVYRLMGHSVKLPTGTYVYCGETSGISRIATFTDMQKETERISTYLKDSGIRKVVDTVVSTFDLLSVNSIRNI